MEPSAHLDPLEAGARASWPGLARRAGLVADAHYVRAMRVRRVAGQGRAVLAIDGPGGALVLKHAPDETEGWFIARIEAQAAAAAALRDVPGHGAAGIVAVDARRRAVLMRRAPGGALHDAIEAAPDAAMRLALLESAARWAGMLHRSGPLAFGRHRPAALLRRIDGFAAEAAARGVADPAAYRVMLDRARSAVEAERGRKIVSGPLHGDLNLRNLILGPDGDVCGIDFDAVGTGPAAADLARLLVKFETLFWQGSGGPEALGGRILAAHGGRWRDGTTLDGHVAFELARLWRTIPADPMRRGILHARRWKGIRRMAEALRG